MSALDNLPELTAAAYGIAREAGQLIMKMRNEALKISGNPDGSTVTAADTAAEDFICKALAKLTPDIPVVAEERAAAGDIPMIGDKPFWLVDPLDGTYDYISGEPEFAVIIALVVDKAPVIGIIHAPALEESYLGAVGHGATRVRYNKAEDISPRIAPPDGLTVLSSRRHGSEPELAEYLSTYNIKQHRRMSSALKFGLLASGEGDIYPRFGRVMAWDIAAGHAILLAAGGRIATIDGQPIDYRAPDFSIPNFIARGKLNG